nr:zinc finger, CCHC-type [Tanacetum cinerariifolium]
MVVVALILWLYSTMTIVAKATVARVRVEVVAEAVVIMVRVRSVVAAGWLGLGLEVVMQENDVWGYRAVVRLSDSKRKTLGEKGFDCIFVGYAEHSKAYRPKDIIPNLVESERDDHSDDVPNKTREPHKGKRVRKAKSHGFDFQQYLVMGSRDQVGSQHTYCYSIEEDPRTYNEAMQSRDAAFWKEAIDDEIGSIMENHTWAFSDLPPGCKPLGCKTDQNRVDKTKKFLSSRFSLKDMGEADVILSIKIKCENKRNVITQSHYIEKILKKFNREDCSPGTMDYDLSYVGYPLVLEAYSDASWLNHVEVSSSTSGCVNLLGGGAISWASKKETCITGSTIVATLAKAYSQMYNGKSRQLGVRHSIIRDLIMNGVISIEFVWSQHNLADHLMKGLARDLVIKWSLYGRESKRKLINNKILSSINDSHETRWNKLSQERFVSYLEIRLSSLTWLFHMVCISILLFAYIVVTIMKHWTIALFIVLGSSIIRRDSSRIRKDFSDGGFRDF